MLIQYHLLCHKVQLPEIELDNCVPGILSGVVEFAKKFDRSSIFAVDWNTNFGINAFDWIFLKISFCLQNLSIEPRF